MQERRQRAASKRETEELAVEQWAKEGSVDSEKFDDLLDEIDDLLGTEEEGQVLIAGFVQQSGQ